VVVYGGRGAGLRQLTWFDHKGVSQATFGPPDRNGLTGHEISLDGRVAVERRVQGNQDVWILEPNPQPFTSGGSSNQSPIWSPDGKWIVFRSNRDGSSDLYIKPSRSVGDELVLVKSEELKVPNDWRGGFLLYYSLQQGLRRLWVLPVTADGKRGGDPRPLTNNPNQRWDEYNGQFSADGRFVAYQSNESNRMEIVVVPFSGKARPRQVSAGGGRWPRWGPNGTELYYLGRDGMLMAHSFQEKDGELLPIASAELFRPRILSSTVSARPQYAVDRFNRFLINVPVEADAASPLTLVLNWRPPSA
jgi:Tol biopolymer transport system component